MPRIQRLMFVFVQIPLEKYRLTKDAIPTKCLDNPCPSGMMEELIDDASIDERYNIEINTVEDIVIDSNFVSCGDIAQENVSGR